MVKYEKKGTIDISKNDYNLEGNSNLIGIR